MGADSQGHYHLGLIGYPLGHSKSPQLHHAALLDSGLSGEYCLYPIPPDALGLVQIRALLDQIRSGELGGLNVTIPHKQAVMPYVDRLSDVARTVGAVNTLYRDTQGLLVGDNTDVPGFLEDLRRFIGPRTGRVVVLGAGGSARAVVYGLGQAGWDVQVLARRVDQAAELVQSIGHGSAGLLAAEVLVEVRCDLFVNTTPLGMHPKLDGCPWPEEVPLPADSAVYDLIYNPLETVLLRRARAASLPAAHGAGMLISQARLAFGIWTGCDVPFQVMEDAFYNKDGKQ